MSVNEPPKRAVTGYLPDERPRFDAAALRCTAGHVISRDYSGRGNHRFPVSTTIFRERPRNACFILTAQEDTAILRFSFFPPLL
jgi:hypothetical protein